MTRDDAVALADASEALRAVSKEEREWVLSLPPHEAMTVIRLLIAFPGTRFDSYSPT